MNSYTTYIKQFKSLTIVFFSVFLILSVLVCLIYFSLDIEIANVVSQHPNSIILFVSINAVITGIVIQKRTSIEKNTLDFEEKYKHDETILKNFKLTIEACNKADEELEKIAKKQWEGNKRHEKLYEAINSTLNEWERAANAINHNLYDEKMLYGVYASAVIHLWKNLLPFIIVRQAQQPRYYINFTCLAMRWNNERIKQDDSRDTEELEKTLNESRQLTVQLNDLVLKRAEIEKITHRTKVDSMQLHQTGNEIRQKIDSLKLQLKELEQHIS